MSFLLLLGMFVVACCAVRLGIGILAALAEAGALGALLRWITVAVVTCIVLAGFSNLHTINLFEFDAANCHTRDPLRKARECAELTKAADTAWEKIEKLSAYDPRRDEIISNVKAVPRDCFCSDLPHVP